MDSDDREQLVRSAAVGDVVAELFCHVLQVSSVDPDENFFDLGGDSLRAIALQAELEKRLGRRIPFAAIYDAPSVRAMAELLADSTDHLSDTLVLMKPAAAMAPDQQRPPLFLFSGIGGTAFELRHVADRIDTTRAIYALQSHGLDGVTAPLTTIEEMASSAIADLRRVQPTGPYSIVGYSMGGLVAFEMARRLHAAGEPIALLGMIDTDLPSRSWTVPTTLHVWGQIAGGYLRPGALRQAARYHLSTLRALLRPAPPSEMLDRFKRAARVLLNVHQLKRHLSQATAAPAAPDAADQHLDAVRRISRANRAATAAYRATKYPGDIRFLQSADPGPIRLDPLLWRAFARAVEVRIVPGNHLSMVRVHFAALADAMSAWLHASPADAPPFLVGAAPLRPLAEPHLAMS